MFTPRVRNPEKVLNNAKDQFKADPSSCSDRLKRLGKQEGYTFIADVLQYLSKTYPDMRHIVTQLRQPEWHWRAAKGSEYDTLFGFVEEGIFKPAGHFHGDPTSPGVLVYYDEVPEGTEAMEGDVSDPRKTFRRQFRLKVYKKSQTRFFVAKVGREQDLLATGLTVEDVRLTNNKGYFKQFEAYALVGGPFKTAALAKEHLNTLT